MFRHTNASNKRYYEYMSHSFGNKKHIGWLKLWIDIQCGIMVVYIMAIFPQIFNLHYVFNISIKPNMLYIMYLNVST